MTKVSCEIPERYVNPLFEVFDGGDFILSSYRDIEKPLAEMRIYFEDAAETEAAKKALGDALEIVLGAARGGTRRTDGAARGGTRRTDGAAREGTRRTDGAARGGTRRTDGAARGGTRRTDGAARGGTRRTGDGAADGRAVSMRPPEIKVQDVPDDDWKFAYRRHFRTEQVSPRIFTVPEWEADEFFASGKLAEGQIAIVSDPGMAFGTGKHETTKACLQYIDEILGSWSFRLELENGRLNHPLAHSNSSLQLTFLDMGTGSGILSIAAAKLGCRDVVGFDVDPEAVQAAKENAEKNGVTVLFEHFALGRAPLTRTSVRVGEESIASSSDANGSSRLRFAPADLVVANILGPLLIRFADEIVPYAKRDLVISGILTTLYPEVLAAYTARGFTEVSHKTIGEWTTGLLSRVSCL